ncbi:hypothetical protein SEA_BANTAM_128 [Gordonia phage Bantam]|uniref:Uncharacterized protein n=1 Tax=Gordonia phage Bantam TaxID=1887641 RepID=A0A1B3AYK5_9CAUD|nr:hypothetical protein BIZ77_gp051 [Gordonia phage Bantam]AOE43817.1 hypothetical protein SEA_BANTAM_128 [Gordonia phage Bantam]
MTTAPDTLLGRPIRGDISHYSGKKIVEQKPIEMLLDALDTLFADPYVVSVRWKQYTPYFNDGDPCEFGVNDIGVRFADTADDAGDYEDGYIDAWSIRFDRQYRVARDGKDSEYPGISDELHDAIAALNDAVAGGAHEVDLRKFFGDPAEVTATREGFDVEFYDHD